MDFKIQDKKISELQGKLGQAKTDEEKNQILGEINVIQRDYIDEQKKIINKEKS